MTKLLTTDEVAEITGLSPETLAAMALAQEGNSLRPAGQEMCSLPTKRY